MQIRKSLLMAMTLLFAFSPSLFAAVSVQFSAGTTAGWNFYELTGDIVRNNTVDLNDLNVLAQHWLDSGCINANQWCGKADIDSSAGVDFIDYAILANNWSKQAGENVLLQTIYGSAQDSAGNITANTYRALSINKGMAMAFKVPQNTALDKGLIKWRGIQPTNKVRIRLYNVTGKNYLSFSGHPTVNKADPGTGGALLFDSMVTTPASVPSHSEGGFNYTDMILNFGPLAVTAGDYMLVFDANGSSNTWGSLVRGANAEPAAMGTYPDGKALPKRATVSTSSATGNTYYYELNATSDTTYTARSNLFACQITTTILNNPPQINAGLDRTIYNLTNFVNLDATVTDDGVPNPPGTVTTTWTKQSGPGTVTFGDASAVDTTATFSAYGVYILRLMANDGLASAYDDVQITYLESAPVNQAPAVNAGIDQAITLPSGATLDGTVTDDGLPNPPGNVTTIWTKQSGPGTVTFANPNAVDTTATFSTDGTYVLRLTANDSLLSNYDELTVTVNPVPATAATLHWDGGGGDNRFENPANWYCADNPARDNTLPTLSDTVRGYFASAGTTANVDITIDTVGVAKVQKWQQKAQVNSLTVQAGATFEISGSAEIYQDDAVNLHNFNVYGTVNACTKSNTDSATVVAFKIGGHQSFATNIVTIYGVLNVLSSDPVGKGEAALWLGYSSTDNNASLDHSRLYIKSAGVVTTDDLLMKTAADAFIDIESGGQLIVRGDEKAEIDQYVADGAIKGNGVPGNVTVTYNSATDRTTIAVP